MKTKGLTAKTTVSPKRCKHGIPSGEKLYKESKPMKSNDERAICKSKVKFFYLFFGIVLKGFFLSRNRVSPLKLFRGCYRRAGAYGIMLIRSCFEVGGERTSPNGTLPLAVKTVHMKIPTMQHLFSITM